MILVRLMGGLGNQMFQVAYARMLALEYGDNIYLDITGYEKYKIRNYSLLNLKINDFLKTNNDLEINKIESFLLRFSQKTYHIYHKVAKISTKIDRYGNYPFKILSKYGLYYNFDRYYYESMSSKSKLKCVYGYFQSEKYFEKYSQQICSELKVNKPVSEREQNELDDITQSNSIAVSMRLGDDYRNSSSLNICNEDYFTRAMDEIFEQHPDSVFYIFSDDIDRAKKINFKYPVRFIEGFQDYESLRLMYSCKHFVISNSSFSWWGAYLADNPNKIIIAPDRWYNDCKIKPDIYFEQMLSLNSFKGVST